MKFTLRRDPHQSTFSENLEIQFNFGADSFVLFGKTIHTLSKNVIATQPLTIRCNSRTFSGFSFVLYCTLVKAKNKRTKRYESSKTYEYTN